MRIFATIYILAFAFACWVISQQAIELAEMQVDEIYALDDIYYLDNNRVFTETGRFDYTYESRDEAVLMFQRMVEKANSIDSIAGWLKYLQDNGYIFVENGKIIYRGPDYYIDAQEDVEVEILNYHLSLLEDMEDYPRNPIN